MQATSYAVNSSYTCNSNLTLYAQWQQNSSSQQPSTPTTYTVTYKANGGSGSDVVNTCEEGSRVTILGSQFSRDYYKFDGWNTNTSGTGTNYSNAQSVSNLTSTNGGTVTLYAKWQANTYTIKYNSSSHNSIINSN